MGMNTQKIDAKDRSVTTDTGATLQIEHSADGATIVSLTYPAEREGADRKALIIVFCMMGVVAIVAWFFLRGLVGDWWALGIVSAMTLWKLWTTLGSHRTATSSYVVRAEGEGIAIQTSRGTSHSEYYVPREEIRDVVIGFGRQPGHGRCWLVIKQKGLFRSFHCLHNIGGNHLARVADVLRAALGMPKRSWP